MLIKARFLFPEILFGLLLAVAIFAMGAVFWSSPIHHQVRAQEQQTSRSTPAKEHINHGFWEKTADDPVAYFTFWLVGFTGVLALVSIFQGAMLLRADKTTRDLFTADQRPWINLSNSRIRVSDDKTRLWFEIDGINIGKTPAFAVEVRARAFRSQIALPSVKSVKDFAKTIRSPSNWKNHRRAIFPNTTANLSAFDGVEIVMGKRGDVVRVTYCVTYFANGDPKIYRTAGEVIFNINHIDSADNVEGDRFAVSHFINDIGVTYAD